jgi:hypothetical protein
MRRCGLGPAAAGAEEVRVEKGQAVRGHGGRVEGIGRETGRWFSLVHKPFFVVLYCNWVER